MALSAPARCRDGRAPPGTAPSQIRQGKPMIRQSSSLLAAALAATAFAAGSANAQRPPAPVGVAEEAVISGRSSISIPNPRPVLVQGPRGNVVELVGGDEVRNFGQIRKGDILTVARGAALVAALEPVDSKATRTGRIGRPHHARRRRRQTRHHARDHHHGDRTDHQGRPGQAPDHLPRSARNAAHRESAGPGHRPEGHQAGPDGQDRLP